MLLETERTYMRPLSENDAVDFFALNQDPEVLKFTGDLPFDYIDSARKFLEGYQQNQTNGLGRLAVTDKQTGKFIGWCGLKYTLEKNEYDIGFRFFKEYWNLGYATETANRCLEFGFIELKLKEIVGRAMVENTASIRVLEKIGMKFKEAFESDLHDGVVYCIAKKDFINK